MDLWMRGDDGAVFCPDHIAPEVRDELPNRPKHSFVCRTDSAGVWTRITPTMAVLEDLSCEKCGARPEVADAGFGKESPVRLDPQVAPAWTRVPFPENWVEASAWPWIVQIEDEHPDLHWHDAEDVVRHEWREQEDGTVLYRGSVFRYRLELIEAPGYGCWLRILHAPVLPGRAGSIQHETVKMCLPAQGGPDDAATIIRGFYHVVLSIMSVGFEDGAASPVGDANLAPVGPLDIVSVDGETLARGLGVDDATTMLRELAGPEGTVHVVNGHLKAFGAVPDPTGARWLDHGHGKLLAFTTAA
ncbi:hypothetical protein [Tsukamurella spumae]|uniref:Uncharacterized protein n=1 Tax=Tsukamurella spumae TaxID=44753 RepID=A0A846X2B1_9ACTN|nr:hypothetical protein [Tsukamurella spumae]NKY19444.1 hypothetical protein [Tsukamurella spumae]